MKIEIFNNEILGELHVFGDENGLWFNYLEVVDCLEIEHSTAYFKYKYLSDNLKQTVNCEDDNGNMQATRFIQEQMVYELMCIGNSPHCDEFRKWVVDVATEYDYLNIRYNDTQLGMCGEAQTNYNVVKEYINRMNDTTPLGKTVKNAMCELDNAFKSSYASNNCKPIIGNKSYRTDYTIDDMKQNPDLDPAVFDEDKVESLKQDIIQLENEIKTTKMTDEEYLNSKKRKRKSSCPEWLKDVMK